MVRKPQRVRRQVKAEAKGGAKAPAKGNPAGTAKEPEAPEGSNPITLSGHCKWQRIGKGLRHYDIGNLGGGANTGDLEIYQWGNGITPPTEKPPGSGKFPGATKIAPDLEPGQSTHVNNDETNSNKWVWVHAKDGPVRGYWK